MRDDRLDGRHFGVLAGDDRHRLIGGAVADALQRGDDADREAVIGRQNRVDMVLGVEGAEEVVHARLGDGGVPTQGRDLVHAHLLGLHDEHALVDIGLQDRHRAVVEVEGVGVVGRPAEELDVERAGLARIEAEALDDGAGLQDADLEIVEGRVIVDVGRTDDQAVIGNDLDAGVGGLLQRVRERRAVDGGDHQRLLLLGDHVLDLRELVGNVVVGVLQVGLVALGLQHLDHVVAVGDPARRGFGRHGDADGALVLSLRRPGEGGEPQRDGGGESFELHH